MKNSIACGILILVMAAPLVAAETEKPMPTIGEKTGVPAKAYSSDKQIA